MDISDISPIGAIGGIIGGLFAFMIASQMMPSSAFGIGVKILTFATSAIACYFVADKMLG